MRHEQRANGEPVAVGQLPESVRIQLAMQRTLAAAVREMRKTQWGKAIDEYTGRAIATWALRNNVDPVTEIDILGGTPYLNARFYMRKLGELAAAGVIVGAYADHIHDDARLQTDEFRAERTRRAHERLKYSIPDTAIAAVAFHVLVANPNAPNGAVEFIGYKHIVLGRTKKRSDGQVVQADPIGDEFPIPTAETRAIRRTMRMVASHVPQARAIAAVQDDAEDLSEELRERRAQLAVTAPIALPDQPTGPRALGAGEYGGEVTPPMQRREPVATAPVVDASATPPLVTTVEPETSPPVEPARGEPTPVEGESSPRSASDVERPADDLFQDDTWMRDRD